MPISIQTNAWSAERHENLSALLAEIADAGYDGFEIGAHRLDLSQPGRFRELAEAHGLTIAGLHTHGAIFDPAAMEAAYPVIAEVARFAKTVSAAHVLLSGRPKEGKTLDDLQHEAEALNRVARLCAAEGVPFLYHTHNWELADDLRELRYLLAHTDPALVALALDAGWVQRAGLSPVAVTREFRERIGYFHVKDTRGDRWTEVGAGEVDFRAWLAELGAAQDLWLTVERDEVLPNAAESARLSRDHLQTLGLAKPAPRRTLGVCVVGCGFMGAIHAERWRNLPRARVLAVADVNAERAQALAARIGATAYTDYAAALRHPGVEVASVCVPTYLHAEVSLAAIGLGKHVLCEKPIALRLEDAERMRAAAQQRGVRLGVGFMRRHSPVVPDLKAWLATGYFGRPVLYQAADIRELRPKRLMHDADGNGGPVIDMAVHLFDLWANIFNSTPAAVSAQGFTLAERRDEIAHIANKAIDTALIMVKYASGDVGAFTVSWGLPPAVNPEAWPDRVYGPGGLLEAEYHMAAQKLRWLKEGGEWETVSETDEDMYQREITAFARALLDGAPFDGTVEHGIQALRLALAVLEAIRTGQTVRVLESGHA
jgi:predicted dehydrogenase/sugar phosphate isomerase/epimerase